MALYLGNNKVSMKSGYTTTGFKDFLEHGGKFIYSKYTDLTDVLKYEDTENVTDMSYMFSDCNNLTTIPQLDTSNVTNMYRMFYGSRKITSIPMLNTSKVTDMSYMFQYSNITTIPKLDTSNVVDMRQTFYWCEYLSSIPMLNTSNVSSFDSCFSGCKRLTEIHMTGMKVSFDIHYSTLFTREALVEILNNLATVTGTKKLTMGSDNLAKLTDEDKAIATNKGWTLA